ncbi:aldehyde dehydrogenase family protein [Evansella cellulosilytica]|uniref:Aldehyde Dehydrogenase n=1 Tax=Evansella cellulosilytica (strain ATCC 21833 / DSM 2522 / FERM P-1141 / JCM 9156 / N-4) TaxID=649639 RepID=E6TTH4_EVAC2|nr:aldehyde dehydrogenase family protein [Evansella cellulosilytica]ADU29610.1 Aldehyde Dehydrogenase [Evansella cellulosilytica DSM 2522]
MSDNNMRDWIASNSGHTYANYINGEWIDSISGNTSPLYESAIPENVLGHFPSSVSEDVDTAVKSANAAFALWKKTSATTRASILYRFADLLEENEEELAYILSAEQGKILPESKGEVKRGATEARFAAGEALRVEGTIKPSENTEIKAEVVRSPIGVIAAIAPWNFPVVTPVRKIAPAIAYGCTVVLKPASATPWSSVKLMELFEKAGLPKGVVNLVIGSGSKVGDPLVSHPLVKGVSFTGSTSLGLRINEIAAKKLAKTQLEMGGKNAALVLDYDNLVFAADQIVSAAFGVTGQRCTAISRVIVLEEQSNRLIALLKEKMENIQVGPAWQVGVNMGPVIDKNQYESVASYIETGKKEGAHLAYGGERLHINEKEGGFYLQPTLFTEVTKNMTIAKEEIFGPVLVVLEAKDVDDAVDIANATEYGLAASVFTNRLNIAHQISESIETGMVHINHGTASQAHVPFGGVKNSGCGAFSIGHSNIDFFTVMKAVYTKPY